MHCTSHDNGRHQAAESQLTLFDPGYQPQTPRAAQRETGLAQDNRFDPGYQPPTPKAPPYVASSATSAAAAQTMRPAAGRLRRLVYDFICSHNGATDQEIADGLDLLPDTARARRCELRDSGHVRDSGDRRTTSRGRPAAVWTATDKSFEA